MSSTSIARPSLCRPWVGDARVKLSLHPVGARFLIQTADQLRSLTISLLETVTAMHGKGLVHRDIRLDNIVQHYGQWILIDWELAAPVGAEVWWSATVTPPGIQMGGPWTFAADLWQIARIIQSCSPMDPPSQRIAQGLIDGKLPSARDALAALSPG